MSLWPLAFIAGVISFSSPCCLPLLPGYLAHISGLVTPGSAGPLRSRTVAGAALFVLGFTLIFALLGASAGLLGGFLIDQRELLLRGAGLVIIAMALLQITAGDRPSLARRHSSLCQACPDSSARSRWAWPSRRAGRRA